MLNDNGPAAVAGSSDKPLQPQQIQIQTQQPQSQPPPPLPSTPVQTVPQQPFRDYGQTQQSPIRQYSQDYGAQNVPPPGAYASSPYQSAGSGQYPNRPPQPPPLQQIAPNELRSPSIGSGPAPSPYRPTPTSSISTASGGYPFPPPQQTPTSPVQRHQYPPASAFHREGYPQPSGAVGLTGPPGASSYLQGPPMPQTPPIGPAGAPHPYPHQRSQSSQSTPTPTSAQSQSGQYGASYVHGSPVATAHQLPQMEHQQRQSSQPPTPIAGPLSGPRAGQTLTFPQPPSPYQHRLQSTPAYHPLPSHSSPPPPPPPSLPRHPSSQSVYESHAQDIAPRRQQSHSERDRSVSISPKTRVPSLPSSTGRPGTSVSVSESEARHAQNLPPSTLGPPMDVDRERDQQLMTPAKRKLEDRELRSDELERQEARPPPFQDIADRSIRPDSANHTPVPVKRPKRKMIHKTAPIWAQSPQGRQLANPNSVIYRPSAHHNHQVNGKSESLVSRHTSPEERRSTVAPQAAPHPQPATQPPARQAAEPAFVDSLLGHFEPCITGEPQRSSLLNRLCDFFFATVVKNDHMDEMQSQGVKFEIEAKFGTLIDRGNNNRISLPVETDCILSDGPWFAFRSSMTEAQHKGFNDFLNEMVMAAHPDNKANIGRPPRLALKYQHRREVDKFFDLPDNVALPEYVTTLLQASGHRPKVRVTYDQKTNEVLAKIIKARVHDIHLFLPQSTLDCRISVNLEMDWEGSVEALANQTKRAPAPDRNKDRLSYSHGLYQVDLTQVTQVVSARHRLPPFPTALC